MEEKEAGQEKLETKRERERECVCAMLKKILN